MVEVICGWCLKDFNAVVRGGKSGDRSVLVCPHCIKVVRSSVKESTEQSTGRLHVHRELRKGDYV